MPGVGLVLCGTCNEVTCFDASHPDDHDIDEDRCNFAMSDKKRDRVEYVSHFICLTLELMPASRRGNTTVKDRRTICVGYSVNLRDTANTCDVVGCLIRL